MLPPFRRPRLERGVAAVEFAMCAIVFMAFVGALVEAARVIYVINTMGEVSRHGARMAAVTNFCDDDATELVRNAAVFGGIPAAGDITKDSVEITYLQADGVTPVASMPASPVENLNNCTASLTGIDCIRFVRVRLCASGSNCPQIGYQPWLPVGALMPAGGIPLPTFSTVTPAENFGYRPDQANSCS
jgi:hypothetical protein